VLLFKKPPAAKPAAFLLPVVKEQVKTGARPRFRLNRGQTTVSAKNAPKTQ
jgi:hypothetical protein